MAPSSLVRIARLLPLLAVAGVLFSACAHLRPDHGESGDPMGKVAIRYEVAAGDAGQHPPAFHVWRAMNRQGPFERLTRTPVLLPDDVRPGTAVLLYMDRSVPIGAEAWYYLEAVDEDGTSRKATAVSRAVALLPAGYDESPPLSSN